MEANEIQIGGSHYVSQPIQPWDFIAQNGLGFFEGCVIKYVSRHRQKGGVEDLKKARHYLDKLIEIESAATVTALRGAPVTGVTTAALVTGVTKKSPFGYKPDGTPYKRRPYGKRKGF
jgi:hypothetical protein